MDKYETITSVFPSGVSPCTRVVGITDLLSSLLAVTQIVKLWPEKGFGGRQTSFLFFKNATLFYAISLYI